MNETLPLRASPAPTTPVSVAAKPPLRSDSSIGDLLRRLVDDLLNLVRSELRLASGEVRANVVGALGGLAVVAAGAMLVSVAMLCLLGAGVAFLAQSVGIVDAALIVAGTAILLGAALIYVGVGKLRTTQLAPRRSVANLRRDVDTLKGD